MIPTPLLDADYTNQVIDAVHHDRSIYMEDRLNSLLGRPGLKCMNFGLPGGMISDDYMVARGLFTGSKKPKVVVLGVSLRDFIESHVPYAASTVTFKYFQQFFDIDDLVATAMPQVWQRADYSWGKFFALWGKRLEVQAASSNFVRTAMTPFFNPSINSRNPLEAKEIHSNVAAKLKTVAEEGEFVFRPHQFLPFEDNTNEYKKRFNSPNPALFAAESEFLDKLLALLHKENIQVVVANMPLLPANMALMPAGSYDRYMKEVTAEAVRHGCVFVDLNTQQEFDSSDFRDTAHMNGHGGKKFVDAIVRAIAADPDLRASLERESKCSALAGKAPPAAF